MRVYTEELDALSSPASGFPFGRGPALEPEAFKAAVKALERVRADAADPAVPADVKKGLEAAFGPRRPVRRIRRRSHGSGW
jgi:hypothetical protein